MKIVIVLSECGSLKDIIPELISAFDRDEVVVVERRTVSGQKENIIEKIKIENPGLLIVENLEGFDMRTLTDAVAYNLIHCRQIHILNDEKVWHSFESVLGGQMSLNMFFMCKGKKEFGRLIESYPQIPYIEAYEDNENRVERILKLSNYICKL